MMRDVGSLSLSFLPPPPPAFLSLSLFLPTFYIPLFLLNSQDSPIIDFYPTNFKVDLNGKKFAWQGVALLPFVDERRLLQALSFVHPNLTPYKGQFMIRCIYMWVKYQLCNEQ